MSLVIPDTGMFTRSVTVRLREDEYKTLMRDAGGPARIPPYLRGLVRGAIWFNSQSQQAPKEDPVTTLINAWME